MNNYMVVNLLIVLISILLLILTFFYIKKLIRKINNNLSKSSIELGVVLSEITEEAQDLNEETSESVVEETIDLDDKSVTSYFEVTNSVVIINSNVII